MTSRPEKLWPPMCSQGCTRRVSHTTENNNAMRVTIASARPLMRAVACDCGGSRPTRIEMKMSMPRTISSSESARKASQRCGSENRAVSSPLRQVVERGLLDRGEQVLRGQTEVERDGTGDIDRGVGAGDDADEQRRGEAA